MTGSTARAQVNCWTGEADVLAAVAFLNDASGAEVLRPVVQEFLRKQRDDPEVQEALRLKARRRRDD